MFLKFFLLSVTILVSLDAVEPELPLTEEEKKAIEYEAVQKIKDSVYRLRYKSDYYGDFSSRELQTITGVNLNKPKNYKGLIMKEMVSKYEEDMRKKRMKAFMAGQKTELQKDLRLLERDIQVLNELTPKEEEQKFKMMLMGSTKSKEIQKAEIKSNLKDMEMVLNKLQTKFDNENNEVEDFKKRATTAEKEIMDLMVQMKRINGHKDTKEFTYSDNKGLNEDSKTFENSIREVIPGEIFGTGRR